MVSFDSRLGGAFDVTYVNTLVHTISRYRIQAGAVMPMCL